MSRFRPYSSLRELLFLLLSVTAFSPEARADFCEQDSLLELGTCDLLPEQEEILRLIRMSSTLASPDISVYLGRYVGRNFEVGYGSPLRLLPPGEGDSSVPAFDIDPAKKFQEMRGFGANLTESCSMVLMQLPPAQRRAVMEKMFSKEKGAGFDILRLPAGASDFADRSRGSYSYNDSPGNNPDPSFRHFDLSRDEKSFALVREAKEINPDLEVMVTPWSAPAWMKTSKHLHGGRLDPAHYQDYANYLAKVIEEYEKRGVPVKSLTIQNEPLYSTRGYPTMEMGVDEQTKFVGGFLGPTLKKRGISTKIFALDHNWELSHLANEMFSDRVAGKFLQGAAFHCYGGSRWNMYDTFIKHPNREVIQTECTGSDNSFTKTPESLPVDFQWWLENQAVGAASMGTSGALGWNLCLDQNNGPQNSDPSMPHNGGCTTCRGMVKVDLSRPSSPEVFYNPEFHALAQVSKFMHKKARRIALRGDIHGLIAVAFENPDGSLVFVAQNKADYGSKFHVRLPDCRLIEYEIPSKGAVTFHWKIPSAS